MGSGTIAAIHIATHLLLGMFGRTLSGGVSPGFVNPDSSVSIAESAPVGTTVYTAALENPFLDTTLILDDDSSTFTLDDNGDLLTASELDCESRSSYVLIITAAVADDPTTATSTLTVSVTDVNDLIPTFASRAYGITIPRQAGERVLQVVAFDRDCTDEHNQFNYSLHDTKTFTIGQNTGIIYTSDDSLPDLGFHTFIARAEDSGGLYDQVGIAVTVAANCGDVPAVDNGTVVLNGNETYYGANATVSCETGYQPVKSTIVCQENGAWETPACKTTTCSNLTDPLNGTVQISDLGVGSRAIFGCDAGFEVVGTATLSCLENGDWSAQPPTCRLKDCGNPPTVPNGSYTTDTGNTTFGTTATYTCKTGYTLAGDSSIVCLYNATWEHAPPTCTIKDCNRLQTPGDGSVSYTNNLTTYGSNASFTCNPGYTLSHTNVRNCTADGTWNGTTPTCNIKDCNILRAPGDGSVSYTNNVTTYRSKASFTCNPGYTLSHTNVRNCTADGTWNGTTPTCNIKDCNRLQTPVDGSVSYTNNVTTYGSKAIFTCNPGYTLSHTNARNCTSDGTWNGTTPTCNIKDCNRLQAPGDGSVSYTNNVTTYRSKASFTCNPGYTLSHANVRNCTADGTWNGTTPTCNIKDCNRLQAPGHGSVSYTNNVTTYGAKASFICNPGYTLSHTTVRNCTADGMWNGTTPTCTIKDCNRLQAPGHGSVSYTNNVTTYGTKASFICNAGYTLSHTTVRNCTADGTWNGTTPTCNIKDCNRLQAPGHGSVSYTMNITTYGSKASFTCSPGYTLSHMNVRNCTANGTWNGTTPICNIKDCKKLQPPSQGSVSYINATTYGSTAKFSCKPGYTLSHSNNRTCSADGTWNGTSPSCTIKDCKTLQSPSHGSVSYVNATTYGSTANFSCDTGYTLSHSKNRTCSADGTWNGTTPKCIINDCKMLPAPAQGSVSYGNTTVTTFGSTATFACNPGYTLSHTNSRTCLTDGSWNGTTPTCNIKDCMRLGSLPDKVSVQYTNNVTTYRSTARFSCTPGYTPSHQTARVCTQDGTWNGTTPACNKKDCKAVLVPSHGSVTYSNNVTTYESTANFSCSSGFTLSHGNIRVCTQNGTWNGSTPTCNRKDCGRISLSSHLSVTYSNNLTTYQSRANFSCTPGYSISHRQTLICRADGTWSGSPPNCTIKDCGSLGAPASGTVDISAGTTFGSTATYACSAGHTLYGDKTRTCLSSGKWGGLAATCIRNAVPVTPCSPDTDNRNTRWGQTPPNTVRTEVCPVGFTGEATRKCNDKGIWGDPVYNCTRQAVKNVQSKASRLNTNSTAAEIQDALNDLSTLTADTTGDQVAQSEQLTHGELATITTSLEDIASVIDEDNIDNETQNNFVQAASDLLDDTNRQTWTTLGESEGVGAERVMSSVDSVVGVIAKTTQASGGQDKAIVKSNIVVQIKKVANEDIVLSAGDYWEDDSTRALLPRAALNGDNVVTSGVIFRNMSAITAAQDNSGSNEREINGPVVAMSVHPPVTTLTHPIRIVFKHTVTGRLNPSCSFWEDDGETWSTSGCSVVSSNSIMTECECDHLTNFAVLMSPFVEADAESTALRIISIVGIGISIVCLILTLIVHFHLWRYLRNDRTTILMHLCVALLVSYVVFLAGVDRTESRVFCAFVAAVLQYLYLVVFCVMLAEGIEIGITVMFVFVKRSRVKPLMIGAWVIPALIVAISLAATQADGYGNDNFCWLSVDSGLIWAFVGPAAAIIVFNLIILIIVIKVMFSTKAMEQKKKIEKAKTGIRSLLVLVPLMGVSWIIGIFYINEDFYWIQYIFAICNGLQGFFIFLFHCLLNPQIKQARSALQRRKSSTTFKSTVRTTMKESSKVSQEHSSSEVRTGRDEADLNHKGSRAEQYFPNSISEEQDDENGDGFPRRMAITNGSNIRLNFSSFNKSVSST